MNRLSQAFPISRAPSTEEETACGRRCMYSARVKTGSPMQRLRRKDLRPKKEVNASTLLSDPAIARAERQVAKANRKLDQR